MKTINALVSFPIVMVMAACGTELADGLVEPERQMNQNLDGKLFGAIDARLEGQIGDVSAEGAAEQRFFDDGEIMNNIVTYRHDDGPWAMVIISLHNSLSDLEFGETVISGVEERELNVVGCAGLTSGGAFNYDVAASTAQITLHAPAVVAPEDVLATVSVLAYWESTGQEVESRFTIVEF